MKLATLVAAVLAGPLLLVAGCGKSDKTPPPLQMEGVQVDLPKFNAAFEEAPTETKRAATEVGFNLRYNKYEQALMSLDKLSSDTTLTEPQKKAVAELIEQVKKLNGAAPAAEAPAQ